ncbi:P-loop containing nucleoside triphosphate hydrolase protein, partial [Lojkania enalia]
MLFWAYPITLWVGYLASRIHQAVHPPSPAALAYSAKRPGVNKLFFALHVVICVAIAATAIITACVAGLDYESSWWTSKNYLSSTIGVGLFYLAGLLPDPDDPYSVSTVNFHMWLISLVYEILLFSLRVGHDIQAQKTSTALDALQRLFSACRIAILLLLVVLYAATTRRGYNEIEEEEGEREALLGKKPSRAGDAQTTTWLDYLLGFKKLFPFLWPSDSKRLQIRVIFCFFLLVCQRAINILAPHQLGVVVAALGPSRLPHLQILLYILFRGLQGQQGVIGSIRALLWIPISQSTYRRLSSAAFKHVLNLSLDFHLSKRVGEVMSALSKGGALNTFLDGLAFQLFPMVADLWIAALYFFFVFDAYYSLMAISVTWFYIYITIYMAKYRGRARREMVKREREMDAAKTDALLSYETVHQSGAVRMEISRYEKLISIFQGAEYNVFFSLNLLNAVQNGVFTLGTLLACYLNAYQIEMEMEQVAMFVTLLTYLAQLQAPLNFFGSFYTQVQNNLIDAERMLELFDEKPTITDGEDAVDMPFCKGMIEFRNVGFAYNASHPALRDVSFEVQPGTSTAIVGESGSGKSTILKLLFRFYDVNVGAITVDGLDVRDIKVDSLRDHIGVVPQDTILFNDTLIYNLLYAKPDATMEEVVEACRNASIHEKILRFPAGYETKVGERGLKLSGGERQRIAIARAFLRSPKILLLDEATSSLDSETERQIQGALEKVSEGRTTITIAHRLSTITKADQIIVLNNGRIVERGTHQSLLAQNGLYTEMWNKQTKTDEH